MTGCLLILLAQAALQVVLARTDSQTTDEAVHVMAGYTYLTEHDFRFNPEHPPLVKVLAALPLLALDLNMSPAFEQTWQESENFFYDSWRENRFLGEEFFYNSGNDADLMILLSRLPMIAVTLLLGLAIFFITRKHFGDVPALVTTGFYALDPLITGHGHLVTTDIALALGALVSIYSFWRFLQQPTWTWAVGFGLSFGFALLTKHTAVILLPILLVMAIGAWFNRERQTDWRTTLLRFVGSLLIVYITLWAGFGFFNRAVPPSPAISQQIETANQQSIGATNEGMSLANREGLELTEEELGNVGEQVSAFDAIYARIQPALIIFPGDYLKGLFLVIGHASGGHDSFLLGETSKTGWWYYFPVLMFFKLPIPTLLAIAVLLGAVIWRRPKRTFVTVALLGAAVFLLSAMTSRANLGLRHIMPVLPLLLIGLGWATTIGKYAQERMIALLLVLSLVFAYAYPNYLGYFNAFARSQGAHNIATDSNLDWGQDLKRIRNYIEERQLEKPVIEYDWLGWGALNYYLGDNYRLLSTTTPAIGDKLIIGATTLHRPEFAKTIQRCGAFERITSGAFSCLIER